MRRRAGMLNSLATCCVALVVSGCAGQPHPTLRELSKLPAANIVYPGAVGPKAGGSDSNRKFGINPAIFQRFEFTNGTAVQVLNYYQQQLVVQGWVRDDSVSGQISYWSQSWGWTMGKRMISVGIIGGSVGVEYRSRFQQQYPQYNGYLTMLEVQLQSTSGQP